MKSVLYTFTITVSSGAGSTATTDFSAIKNSGGSIESVVITPPNPSVGYDFYIKNSSGKTLYDKKNITGDGLSDRKVSVAKGEYTLEISNADVDGSYSVDIMYRADW